MKKIIMLLLFMMGQTTFAQQQESRIITGKIPWVVFQKIPYVNQIKTNEDTHFIDLAPYADRLMTTRLRGVESGKIFSKNFIFWRDKFNRRALFVIPPNPNHFYVFVIDEKGLTTLKVYYTRRYWYQNGDDSPDKKGEPTPILGNQNIINISFALSEISSVFENL